MEIDKGKNWPQGEKIQQYHRDIDMGTLKFRNALDVYQGGAANGEEKDQLKQIMDQQLAIIGNAVKELKRAGIYKQEVKVENDYKEYLNSGSPESFAALSNDLETLREYNQLP